MPPSSPLDANRWLRDLASRSVLVIDDHPFMRELVKGLLHDIGFRRIQTASDGAAALSLLAGDMGTVDVIICDVDMEPMNGLDFLNHLRNHDLELLRMIPVIMLTSHGDRTTVLEAKSSGSDAYLLKPVSRTSLEERIKFVLRVIG
jgi:two-component system, chemotaxis family, chemotaxis protein CheY